MPAAKIVESIANDLSHKFVKLAGIVGHCVFHWKHHVLPLQKGRHPFLVMKLLSDRSQTVAQLILARLAVA